MNNISAGFFTPNDMLDYFHMIAADMEEMGKVLYDVNDYLKLNMKVDLDIQELPRGSNSQ